MSEASASRSAARRTETTAQLDDEAEQSWLGRVLARLGLADGPDLRDTIEAALQDGRIGNRDVHGAGTVHAAQYPALR